jgi:hypothetical protein
MKKKKQDPAAKVRQAINKFIREGKEDVSQIIEERL